ncbi:MAG: GYD domain-containing protein [Quisquiliibacterium sp.]
MALYMTKATYSAAAFQGMLANPSDREKAARALFAAAGVTIHQMYFEVSSGSVVVISEGSVEQYAALGMVTGASAAFDSIQATELISMSAMSAAMKTAQGVAKTYAAPNKS